MREIIHCQYLYTSDALIHNNFFAFTAKNLFITSLLCTLRCKLHANPIPSTHQMSETYKGERLKVSHLPTNEAHGVHIMEKFGFKKCKVYKNLEKMNQNLQISLCG